MTVPRAEALTRAGDGGAPPMTLVARPCPICGVADQAPVFAEATFDPAQLDAFAFASRKTPDYRHHRLLSCPSCDLLFASPAPSLPDLAQAYDAAAYDSGDEARLAARTYASLLPLVVDRLPDRQSAVDVGAGNGAFLEQLLRAGFDQVTGIEPSAGPIAAAPATIRARLRHGMFRAEDHADASLSLVTCFQTLEHLSDPLQTCRDFRRVLKPGGAVLLVCHDRRALSARLLGRRSPIFDIEHLQLFSPRSVRRLLDAAGFTDIALRRIVNRYPLHYWAKLLPLPPALKRPLVTLLRAPGLRSLPLPLPAGNLAAIAFRPH